jgi:hypothetical protein
MAAISRHLVVLLIRRILPVIDDDPGPPGVAGQPAPEIPRQGLAIL